jgi:hypothetical protein
MPPVMTGLILGGAASFAASILTVVAAMLSSRISRWEEELELVEYTCTPENLTGLESQSLLLED